jgi:hypothetical protein
VLDLILIDGDLDLLSPSLAQDLYSAGWQTIIESDAFQCFHIYRQKIQEFSLWGHRLKDFFSGNLRQDLESKEEALDKAFPATRRALFTTGEGRLGSSRRPIVQGDLVYIIEGADFPVILRRIGDKLTVIGESYIEGLMLGEAMKDLKSEKYTWETLSIH